MPGFVRQIGIGELKRRGGKMKNDCPKCPVVGCNGKLDREGAETSNGQRKRKYQFCSECEHTEFR